MKLHLGCGKRNFGSDWIHIDGGDYPHLDGRDICSLPYDNESADLIYACHVLEYFDREEAIQVLTEWKRILKIGGILRIAVPDFDAIVRVYTQTGRLSSLLGPLYGKISMGNITVYHKTIYNECQLMKLMCDVGFDSLNIYKYDWKETEHAHQDDHSQAYLPHMNKENGILISLNMEAIK
jgi:predicted SAM-dependent methyltransferase